MSDSQPSCVHCGHGDGAASEAAAAAGTVLGGAQLVATDSGHPFYQRLNQVLEERGFDGFVEEQCERFYAKVMGRPSLVPGRYFRLLLIGYFEGSVGERGIAWRAADSLALRHFLELELSEAPSDHSTISRTRRLIDVKTHQAVFRRVLEVVAEKGQLKGKTVGIDATTLEANVAVRSIVRRDTGRRLRGVSAAAGGRIGHRNADARAVCEAGPQTLKKGVRSNVGRTHILGGPVFGG